MFLNFCLTIFLNLLLVITPCLTTIKTDSYINVKDNAVTIELDQADKALHPELLRQMLEELNKDVIDAAFIESQWLKVEIQKTRYEGVFALNFYKLNTAEEKGLGKLNKSCLTRSDTIRNLIEQFLNANWPQTIKNSLKPPKSKVKIKNTLFCDKKARIRSIKKAVIASTCGVTSILAIAALVAWHLSKKS